MDGANEHKSEKWIWKQSLSDLLIYYTFIDSNHVLYTPRGNGRLTVFHSTKAEGYIIIGWGRNLSTFVISFLKEDNDSERYYDFDDDHDYSTKIDTLEPTSLHMRLFTLILRLSKTRDNDGHSQSLLTEYYIILDFTDTRHNRGCVDSHLMSRTVTNEALYGRFLIFVTTS